MPDKPTHRLQSTPQMRSQDFAEYMAASDRAKRSILQRCKYRSLARMVQHREARIAIARWLREGNGDPMLLDKEADRIRHKLTDDDFDAEVNEHNATYIEAFRAVCADLNLPACEMRPADQKMAMDMGGLEVRFAPDLLLYRTNSRNVPKSGALFLVYSKGKAAKEEEALFLSSISFGYLSGSVLEEELGEPEKGLCLSVCAYSGTKYAAPGNAKTRFNNMKAAGAMIADVWDAIQPPNKAVLA